MTNPYTSPETYRREAQNMVPDLYRPTTPDDNLYAIRTAEGWTVNMHESYDDEAIAEFYSDRPLFATRNYADRWAWFWMMEEIDDETEFYSDAAKALLEALEESGWEPANGKDLDEYNEIEHRLLIHLKSTSGEELWFATVEEAHTFLMEIDGVTG